VLADSHLLLPVLGGLVELASRLVEIGPDAPERFGASVGLREPVSHEILDARIDERREFLVGVRVCGARRAQWQAQESFNTGTE
jgi:hypothetical protein